MDNANAALKRLDGMDARASEANPRGSWRWERRYAEDLPAATKLLRALLVAQALSGSASKESRDARQALDAALAEFAKGDGA